MKTTLTILTTCFLYACSGPQTTENKGARNKERMQQFYAQLVNAHNAAMVDSFFDANVIDHQSGEEITKGAVAVRNGFEKFFTALPDAHLEQQGFFTSGDTVAVQLTMTGTNTGPWQGGPATNKTIRVPGVAVFVLKDGKITERWRYFDDLLMMQQLGMAPQPPEGEKEK